MHILQTPLTLPQQVEALSLRSSQARLRADSANALLLAEQAWRLANTAPADNVAVRLNALVELTLFHLSNDADYPTALKYAFEWKGYAEQYAAQLGDSRWLGFALTVIGDCFHRAGIPHKALEYYAAAMPIRMLAGDDSDIGWTLYNFSAAYHAIGNAQNGITYALAAHKYAQQSGKIYGQVATLTMLGGIAITQSQYSHALHHLQSAETLLRANGYLYRLPDVLHRMAAVMRSTGNNTQALELLEEAEDICTKGHLRASLAATYREQVLTLRAVKDVRKADQYLERALSLEETLRGATVQRQLAMVEAKLSLSLDLQSALLLGLPSLQTLPTLQISPSLQVQPSKRKKMPHSKSPTTLLTPTEWRVAKLLADNWKHDSIAKQLTIELRTVGTHRTNIINKMKEHYGVEKASDREITLFVQTFG
jgi:tetratricopeptide (TPR) repeat protein